MMAHVTTPDEADKRVADQGIYDSLADIGLFELASWIREAARALPYMTDEHGGLASLETDVHMIVMWHALSEE